MSRANFVRLDDIIAWSSGDGEMLVRKLMEYGALPKEGTVICKFGHEMRLTSDEGRWWWKCSKSARRRAKSAPIKCKEKRSICTNSFFERSQLSHSKICRFVHQWVRNDSRNSTADYTNIG